jgi:hypothetical protein
MSRPRRRNNNSSNNNNRGRQQAGDGRNARSNASNGGNRNAGGSGKGRRARQTRQSRPTRTSVEAFWGDPEPRPPAVDRIRPTTDPAAVPRSLGEPPLTPDTAAPHHLAVVYEEAVRTATALAAANGLLQGEDHADPTDAAPE